MKRGAKGFTLAEIAIVLIIISALLTGVLLTGSSVLDRVRVASLLSAIKDLAVAAQTFKTRYGYYPGDLPNAATYITSNGGVSGPCSYAPGAPIGNGIVDTATESDCGLEHLVKAGLLTKLDYDNVNSKYMITSSISPTVRVVLGFNSATNENIIKISNLPCSIALEIDGKFDSTTTANTPFIQGLVVAHGSVSTTVGGVTTVNPDAPIPNCTAGGGAVGYDPVPTLLIKY